jgi:hypothetical protein
VSCFGIAVLKPSHDRKAVKRRLLEPNGDLVKSDHTLFVKMWFMANVSVRNDADSVAELLRGINPRSDIATVHGAVAPGIDPSKLQPRWSSESHGASCTLLNVDRPYIPFDIDKAPLAEGSAAGKGGNLYAFAEQVRDEILPRAFRHCELVIRASSSTGLNPCRGSLHCYALLDQPVPLPKIYRWLKGLQASGLPFDPRPAIAGQLFLSGRQEFVGLADPVPVNLRSWCCQVFSASRAISTGVNSNRSSQCARRPNAGLSTSALARVGARFSIAISVMAEVDLASSHR